MRPTDERPRVAYQGAPGAFGEDAIVRYWGGRAEPVAAPTFAAAVDAVRAGSARYAVLPVWNSTIGRIAEAWDAIAADRGAAVVVSAVGEITIPVRHALLCRPGVCVDAITAVLGHPAALAQCANTLAARGVRAIRADDSASAARALGAAATGVPLRVPGSDAVVDPLRTATLAPVGAAARYRLAVLSCGVQDRADNRTSFLVVQAVGESGIGNRNS
ncbi:MAG TPA: prephenate dehydratase domain-containing protein [Gemmatimonadaceae bacterium]|nr:prephenate dehydratase domain-containing protein [Gemmatimonadaceae bacterium]